MPILLVASSAPRAGRSLVAAAIAYRLGRGGRAVTLARLAGDDSASPDAAAFSALEGIVTPGRPIAQQDLTQLPGDLVLEAPPGDVAELARALDARVVSVATGTTDAAASDARRAGTVLTQVTSGAAARAGDSPVAVLREDRLLAAPAVADIAGALDAEWLAGSEQSYAIERVMIGTVASDAAAPYFGERRRTCIITRFDKTDIQLAALQTDLECLVLTGGGEPSPYLLDRVRGGRDQVAVLRTGRSTVEAVRAVEGLYTRSRFEGQRKLERAVQLLDEAAFEVAF
jgi:BioD-like phosphotransacetylase family protein